MTKAENLEMAGEFASSMRGRFIIAKALHYGIQELEKVEGVHKEKSDIDDMYYLKETVFNFPVEVLAPRKAAYPLTKSTSDIVEGVHKERLEDLRLSQKSDKL